MSSNTLRITPAAQHPTSQTSIHSAPSAPGLYDTLRASQTPLNTLSTSTTTTHAASSTAPTPLTSTHPLEARLAHWRSTQQNLKHALLRRQYGVSAVLTREMELLTVRNGDAARPSVLGGRGCAGLHEDVLLGRDCEIDGWEDVYSGDGASEGGRVVADVHAEMEQRLGMNW